MIENLIDINKQNIEYRNNIMIAFYNEMYVFTFTCWWTFSEATFTKKSLPYTAFKNIIAWFTETSDIMIKVTESRLSVQKLFAFRWISTVFPILTISQLIHSILTNEKCIVISNQCTFWFAKFKLWLICSYIYKNSTIT